MKTWLSAGACAAVILGTAAFAKWYFAFGEPAPLNVVVVSACSLRADRVGRELSPHLNRWSKGAFTFTNAIAEKPWQISPSRAMSA